MKNPRFAVPERADFDAVARAHAANAPTRAEVDAAMAKTAAPSRAQRLEEANLRGAITSDDWRRITTDTGLDDTHALRVVKRWLVTRPSSARPFTTLVLVGGTGRGKTVAGAWLIAQFGGAYVQAEVARRLYASIHKRDHDQLDGLLSKRVLVVDDLGTERDDRDAMGMLYHIVNDRSGLGSGWTLLTANLSRADFDRRYGERTIRRIEHQGLIFTVDGNDLRRRGNAR